MSDYPCGPAQSRPQKSATPLSRIRWLGSEILLRFIKLLVVRFRHLLWIVLQADANAGIGPLVLIPAINRNIEKVWLVLESRLSLPLETGMMRMPAMCFKFRCGLMTIAAGFALCTSVGYEP